MRADADAGGRDFTKSPRRPLDCWKTADSATCCPYHPGQWTWRGRSVAGQFSLSIDHILFDGSMVPLDAWVSSPGNSDHNPVVAHFEAAQNW